MKLEILVGSGRKIGLLAFPFIVLGLALNIWKPSLFSVGGPNGILRVLSIVLSISGIIVWAWSVFLIATKVPKEELITTGPYALIRHPLYVGVAILVLPWLGFLCNSWLGIVIGIIVYVGSRIYAPEEEKALSVKFGEKWDDYTKRVKLPWL